MGNKNAGFIVLVTSIFTFFFFGEIRNLTTFTRLNNNGFSLSFFFLSFLSLDRCSIPSREVSILWSYLDIGLLFSSYVYLIIYIWRGCFGFQNSFFHLEVASDSFCLLINSPWLLVFILYVFSFFFLGFNLY